MSLLLENISDESNQRHTILFEESEITFILRYHITAQIWTFDVSYNGLSANGIKLSIGTLHMRSRNFPFDFAVDDTSNTGIDPFRKDDFSQGRCNIYLVTREEMTDIRGLEVPI